MCAHSHDIPHKCLAKEEVGIFDTEPDRVALLADIPVTKRLKRG